MKEGYIKFNIQWIKESCHIPNELLGEINSIRSGLQQSGYLGVLPNGVGFGNISIRDTTTNRFFITGSATGGVPVLETSHIALVEHANIESNFLVCRGLTAASSESMSHAVLYQTFSEIMAVIHIHSSNLWNNYLNCLPTTDFSAEYGTPEMAYSIERLTKKTDSSSGVIVMGGHQDGLISFAPSLQKAFQQLIKL
jgi:L-ribulose-5-phosphate 4-epimerase